MVIRPQKTKFQIKVIENLDALTIWAINPWRKYSFTLVLFLIGYFFGSSIGLISDVLALMDPIAALISLIFIECLISLRRILSSDKTKRIYVLFTDFLRYGLYYGFFTEAIKLL
tara:strand:- start:109 stop:450 length:342 start_codon:yes stop_codon:yes gene_type:complete